jgi:uncharacterized membrane protein
MTAILVLVGGVAAIVFLVWMLARASRNEGLAEASRREAQADAEATRKAAEIVVEHRSDDATADRLSNGRF